MEYTKTNKRGISLIVLVITITSTYDEVNKIDKNPPENRIINENKIHPKCLKKGLTFWVYFYE